MSTEFQSHGTTETEKKEKKRRSTGLLILLIIFLILFLLTTAILSARLYDLTTRDKYTVDLGLGEPVGSVELFRIEYENELGEITVQGLNADHVVAPGTSVDYDLRLRNNEDVIIDFLMTPSVEFLTEDPVPIQFKILDNYGNYILGSDTQWGTSDDMNNLAHKGSIHPGEVFTYHVSWQWIFEVSEEQDTYDTYLGNQNGEILPGVRVGISTESAANAQLVTKDITHVTHLRGDNFGCCWCCWLVWVLLLVCLLLIIRIWRLKKKLNKLEETLDEYKELLPVGGKPVT